MAAAEAKTAWQRSANHCFFQENARRTSKFSCSPSSSSSRSESDNAHDNDTKGPHDACAGLLPFNPNSILLTDRKWWLNMQPNAGNYKDIMSEQLNSLEAEVEALRYEFISKTANSCEDQTKEVFSSKTKEQLWNVSATSMKNEQDTILRKLKADFGDDSQRNPVKKDVGDLWYTADHYMNLDSLNNLVSQQPKKLSSDLELQWIGTEKTEPWWRTAGKDDLAFLVAQKSIDHIENCDLPRPQSKHRRNGASTYPKSFDHDEIRSQYTNLDFCPLGSPVSGCSPHDSDQTFRCSNGYSTTSTEEVGSQNVSDNDQTKAQLLEALCHSQTRAREAEKAAKQAYIEKEHIITLFFRQASQLFAYKQWIQLLQLENLCLQLKNNNEPISGLFPLPWIPCKGRQMKKGQNGAEKRSQGKPRFEISCKSAVAFALGLGLASAGLLLGWTMGWLFPSL
ncbi:hypothetical protein FNV43_RR23902 [Rhamnella rubrinervis]|uniref:Uncharacterized protein n=1 Tax=Rhamnella rubrinervis TaxID=2594499 RepID=A0A8K0DKQ7_9ROSA|nr:hypothetical protein FNV43_RR23902 [Rhamnella rubrinervis]